MIKSLITVTFKLINHFNETQQQMAAHGHAYQHLLQLQSKESRAECTHKVIHLIDAICKYSIEQESARGESVEDI